MLARHRHTRGVNDVGLNAARLEPACQPEAVTARREGNDNAFDPSRPAALFSLGLNPRMPSRIRVAYTTLFRPLCSPTRLSRSRLGRLASSSFNVGMATT